jgi:1,2-diacylglycerol 3-alpha-glucosyltransferase
LYTAVYLRHYLPALPPHWADYLAERLMRWLWPRQTRLADSVIAPATAVAQTMRRFGVTTPCDIIPNGIEVNRFAHAEPLPRASLGLPLGAYCLLVYVGRLAAEKNVAGLLTAVQIAQQQYQSPIHLWLIGDGPQRAHLQQQADALGITPHVTFAGAISPDDLPRYLATADVGTTASLSEVHPLTLLEAGAAGLPLVVYGHESLTTAVDASHTIFTPPDDPAQLAQAWHSLALNPARRQQMRHAAEQVRGRYDIAHTIAAMLALFRRLGGSGWQS